MVKRVKKREVLVFTRAMDPGPYCKMDPGP